MTRPAFPLSTTLLALALVAPIAAQHHAPGGWRSAAGVATVDGQPYAVGPDYRACFDARGMAFTPALGRRAAEPRELRYELDSVRRGAVTWFEPTAPCAPAHDGHRVVFAHRPDLREVYEARADGLEQTFVFDQRPEGSGDLVVRGRIATDLPLERACPNDGLRYVADGVGGITIGGVTGIDADGARAAGTVHHGDGFVEFTLPAAFVDGAAYPLVLDPLIGTAFPIGDVPGGIDRLPAVSFDASTQRWLVVWVVQFSSSSAELRGQLLNATGAAVFGVSVLSTSANISEPPTVVNVNAMNRFLVVFGSLQVQVMGIHCIAVSASNGSASSVVPIFWGTSSYASHVAAGGDARTTGDKVLVAYTQWGPSQNEHVRYLLVQVPAGGDPVVGFDSTIATNTTAPAVFGDVAVSRSCGTAGRWLVAYRQFKDVRCAAISEVGTLCSPVTTVYTASLFNGIRDIRCATKDGTGFAVAWHENSILAPPRLRAMPVNLLGVCPATVSPGAVVTAVADTGGADTFALDFARDSYVAAWSQVVGGNQHVHVRSLDPATCIDCGTSHAVEPAVAAQDEPALASRWSSGDTASDEALVVWTDGTIRGRRCESRGAGAVTNLGGACVPGSGNVPGHAGAPVLGDPTFALTLSSPSAPVLGVLVGLSNVAAPCGACTLVPNLDIVLTGPGPHPIPLPCDTTWLGVSFWTQWVLLAPGGCPLIPEFALSSAQQFTIGE